MIRYSFIIPVKEINHYIRESIPKILTIPRDDYEIIIYPDTATTDQWSKTRQIATDPGGPAMKRTLAIRDARGEVLIFIDDDAYPRNDILDRLDENFCDPAITAVGGPAITPPDDSFWQRVSGAVYLSRLSGGYPERYIPVGKKHFIDDWPSVNLSIRTSAFKKIGGFNSEYWPGEDTKLCLDLIRAGGKILYDPTVIVWHHRRPGLRRHLRQVGRYGLHRGFFAKRFPETSLRISYFIPTAFVLFIILGAIATILWPFTRWWYLGGWCVYAIGLGIAFREIHQYEKSIAIAAHATYYIFLTHIIYGIRFMQGLCTRELRSKLRV